MLIELNKQFVMQRLILAVDILKNELSESARKVDTLLRELALEATKSDGSVDKSSYAFLEKNYRSKFELERSNIEAQVGAVYKALDTLKIQGVGNSIYIDTVNDEVLLRWFANTL